MKNFNLRFLSDTWAVALFHDRFTDFKDEIREILTSMVCILITKSISKIFLSLKNNGLRSVESVLGEHIDNDLIVSYKIEFYFKT